MWSILLYNVLVQCSIQYVEHFTTNSYSLEFWSFQRSEGFIGVRYKSQIISNFLHASFFIFTVLSTNSLWEMGACVKQLKQGGRGSQRKRERRKKIGLWEEITDRQLHIPALENNAAHCLRIVYWTIPVMLGPGKFLMPNSQIKRARFLSSFTNSQFFYAKQ